MASTAVYIHITQLINFMKNIFVFHYNLKVYIIHKLSFYYQF